MINFVKLCMPVGLYCFLCKQLGFTRKVTQQINIEDGRQSKSREFDCIVYPIHQHLVLVAEDPKAIKARKEAETIKTNKKEEKYKQQLRQKELKAHKALYELEPWQREELIDQLIKED